MTNNELVAQIDKVLARAVADEDLRKGLLTDPRRTLQTMTDCACPEELRLKFIEKGRDCDVLFVLPDPVPADELSAEELEAVAGGVGVDGPATIYDPTGGCSWNGE